MGKEKPAMLRSLIVTLAAAMVLVGCGAGAGATATGAATTTAQGTGSEPGGNGTASFCEAAARLELADASNRQEIQSGLENATPAEMVDAVAVIRTFMERQANGDDPYKDPDFLEDYGDAVQDVREHCGIG
jgi:basic membrane lipoprotein Med (substrate-binding protein (PBP1-ABC) superfamily)